ncbi:hypothetical protein PV797_07155 [Clostridiaceae bacterium M8S5]|nr:hypothetical protein PV797_07155 [Clostridiaceae bacterium M8S5]
MKNLSKRFSVTAPISPISGTACGCPYPDDDQSDVKNMAVHIISER